MLCTHMCIANTHPPASQINFSKQDVRGHLRFAHSDLASAADPCIRRQGGKMILTEHKQQQGIE